MKYHLEYKCDIHENVFDCPDHVIHFSKSKKPKGIIIHDGGTSYYKIKFCPFCGKKINSKSNESNT